MWNSEDLPVIRIAFELKENNEVSSVQRDISSINVDTAMEPDSVSEVNNLGEENPDFADMINISKVKMSSPTNSDTGEAKPNLIYYEQTFQPTGNIEYPRIRDSDGEKKKRESFISPTMSSDNNESCSSMNCGEELNDKHNLNKTAVEVKDGHNTLPDEFIWRDSDEDNFTSDDDSYEVVFFHQTNSEDENCDNNDKYYNTDHDTSDDNDNDDDDDSVNASDESDNYSDNTDDINYDIGLLVDEGNVNHFEFINEDNVEVFRELLGMSGYTQDYFYNESDDSLFEPYPPDDLYNYDSDSLLEPDPSDAGPIIINSEEEDFSPHHHHSFSNEMGEGYYENNIYYSNDNMNYPYNYYTQDQYEYNYAYDQNQPYENFYLYGNPHGYFYQYQAPFIHYYLPPQSQPQFFENYAQYIYNYHQYLHNYYHNFYCYPPYAHNYYFNPDIDIEDDEVLLMGEDEEDLLVFYDDEIIDDDDLLEQEYDDAPESIDVLNDMMNSFDFFEENDGSDGYNSPRVIVIAAPAGF